MRKSENGPVPCEYIEDHQTDKSIEDLYIEMEDYQKVISCIDEMDDKYRDVLRLKILHHLNSKETGKILNISEYNVNVRFMRAKAILARKLEERNKMSEDLKKKKVNIYWSWRSKNNWIKIWK